MSNPTTFRPVSTQVVSLSNVSAQSTAIGTAAADGKPFHNEVVRLFSTVDCFVEFGSNPTATTSKIPLSAGVAEYFDVTPGDKIAGILASGTASLYITTMLKATY